MPFTLAHPLAVIPFRKTRMDMTALIIGSMAPDFDYFYHTHSGFILSHSLPGIIYYCLPITISVALLWHFVVKASLASALPLSLCCKYSDWLSSRWEFQSFLRIIVIIVSAVAGVMTHLAWDSFTHINGFFVQNIDFLTRRTFVFNFPLYKLLQYSCGLVGASMVLFVIVRHSSQEPPMVVRHHLKIFWITALSVFIVLCTVRYYSMQYGSMDELLKYTIVILLSGIVVSITLASIVVRIYSVVQRSKNARSDI